MGVVFQGEPGERGPPGPPGPPGIALPLETPNNSIAGPKGSRGMKGERVSVDGPWLLTTVGNI